MIFCDRLQWQTMRGPMLLFGALIGAKRCWIIDNDGLVFSRLSWMILVVEPLKLLFEIIGSCLVIISAWIITSLLELLIKWQRNIPKRIVDNSLRLLFIRATPASGSQMGGAVSHINGFTYGVLAEGGEMSFLSNDFIAGLDNKRTPVQVIKPSLLFSSHRMVFEIWNNFVFTLHALKHLRQSRPSCLYQRYSRFSWAGVALSYLTGIPLALEYNGSEVWIGRYWDEVTMLWLLRRFERVNLLAADLIFVTSEADHRNLLRAGIESARIIVNPNGVNPEIFKPTGKSVELPNQLSIRKRIIVGFVGTFGPWHGVLTLAAAIIRIGRQADCHFLLIGEGKERAEFERRISVAGLADLVTLVGQVNHHEVPGYLDICDILVSPHVPMEDGSEFFGSPTKLFEYMAMEKAVIASRLGQIADIIEDQISGLLVEPGNADALAEAIIKLSHDQMKRISLGKQARLRVCANYLWQHNAARVLTSCRKLLVQIQPSQLMENTLQSE
ncbi:MAG: glycosyltransferase family 4 protein [Acidobacteriota bacterium]